MNLRLTSPWTRGEDVTNLQKALKRRGWLQGAVDGVYGPDTARAVKRGKYWMGYRVVDGAAADLFYGYCTGKIHLTPAMQARMTRRQKAAEQEANRLKMIKEARKHIGVKESPAGSNRCLFSNWYGMIGPWCAMFVTYCGVKHGVPYFTRGKAWAYVPYMVADARAGRSHLAITYDPQEGDLVTFDWDNDGIADHIGFFDHWKNAQKTIFATVEGNTSLSNNSNGGEVMNRERNKSDVLCFIHAAG
jgi:Putative peptidoglycan binding domain/CHAP domain